MPISRITGASIEDGSIVVADLGITTFNTGTGNTLTLQANSATGLVIDVTGNTAIANSLSFSATGARIRGDFSNATVANRVAFQTSTANNNTALVTIPNGTATFSGWQFCNNPDPNNAAYLQVGASSTLSSIVSGIFGSGTYLPIAFFTNVTERMRIDTSGNVGVGTSNPTQRLTVRGGRTVVQANSDLYSLQIEGASGAGQYYIGATNEANPSLVFSNVGGVERARIDTTGNVGIGTNSPSQRLHVAAGTILASNTSTNSATVAIAGNGSAVGTSAFELIQGGSSEAYVYNRANSFLVLGTNNTERMRILADGSVRTSGIMGINGGTPGTDYALNINATTGVNGGLLAWNSGTTISTALFSNSTGGNLVVRESAVLLFGTNNTERMRITSAGNVGIGTSSPGYRQTISGSANTYPQQIFSNTNTAGEFTGLLISTNQNNYFGAIRLVNTTSNPSVLNPHMTFMLQNSGTEAFADMVERMRIDSVGRVLINRSSTGGSLFDNCNLQVTGNISISRTDPELVIQNTGSAPKLWRILGSSTAGSIAAFRIYDGSSDVDRLWISTDGNVGIGTTGPSSRLHVAGGNIRHFVGSSGSTINAVFTGDTVNDVYEIRTQKDGAIGTNIAFLNQNSSGSPVERMRINSIGYVGIGSSTNNDHPLLVISGTSDYAISAECSHPSNPGGVEVRYTVATVNNNGAFFFLASDPGATRCTIKSNGGINNFSGNNSNLSDVREKKNINLAGSYLDKICAIPVKTFNYIDQNQEEDDGLTLGVIAQDVQAVAPELVSESDWGTEDNPKMRLSVYQTDLQFALMKCIQEQQAIIESLTARIETLEKN